MRKLSLLVALIALALLEMFQMQIHGGSSDRQGARDIIVSAISSHGGKKNLLRLTEFYLQQKGTIYAIASGRTERSPVSFDYWYQAPERIKYTLILQYQDHPLTVTRLFDGKRGIIKVNDKTDQLPETALEGWRHTAHVCKAKRLYPLVEESGFSLTILPETRIDGSPANAVKVEFKGRQDLNLYFNKGTGLLVKIAHRCIDDDGKFRLNEEFFSAYKDINGLKACTRYSRFIDGRKNIDLDLVDLKLDARFDPDVFARP